MPFADWDNIRVIDHFNRELEQENLILDFEKEFDPDCMFDLSEEDEELLEDI